MDEIAENCTRAAVISGGKVEMCERPSELFRHGEALRGLGLDTPLTSKISEELAKSNITIECDCTAEDFTRKVLEVYGCGNA